MNVKSHRVSPSVTVLTISPNLGLVHQWKMPKVSRRLMRVISPHASATGNCRTSAQPSDSCAIDPTPIVTSDIREAPVHISCGLDIRMIDCALSPSRLRGIFSWGHGCRGHQSCQTDKGAQIHPIPSDCPGRNPPERFEHVDNVDNVMWNHCGQ